MSEEKLKQITNQLRELFYDGRIFFNHTEDNTYLLLNIICSLHNELYKEVTGEYYDYMFHWWNKGGGGYPVDDMYKNEVDEFLYTDVQYEDKEDSSDE